MYFFTKLYNPVPGKIQYSIYCDQFIVLKMMYKLLEIIPQIIRHQIFHVHLVAPEKLSPYTVTWNTGA